MKSRLHELELLAPIDVKVGPQCAPLADSMTRPLPRFHRGRETIHFGRHRTAEMTRRLLSEAATLGRGALFKDKEGAYLRATVA
jgi:hypothetical protein